MAPGNGDASAASYLQKLWKAGDLSKVLLCLQASKSIHFHKELKFYQGVQLSLPVWFIKEHAYDFEEWAILRTPSSSKPWRVRVGAYRTTPGGSPQVRFVGGWKQFSTENRLKRGDSLVFVLNVDARSQFQVYIFRGTGTGRTADRDCRTPDTNESDNNNGARISGGIEIGVHARRHNLRSAGDGITRKTGDRLVGKKKKVEEGINQNFGDRLPGLKSSDYFSREPSPGYRGIEKQGAASEVVTGSRWKGFAPQHGEELLPGPFPSFRKRLIAHTNKRLHHLMEVPASFVKMHGMPQQLQDDVILQGIHQDSPVRIVTCHWQRQDAKTLRLYFKAGWPEFAEENGLKVGQELQFTLIADSFFAVREY